MIRHARARRLYALLLFVSVLLTDQEISFSVEGSEDAEITVGAAENTEYQVLLDDVNVGHMTTNMGGKLSFSVELSEGKSVSVKIVKV